LEAVPALYSNNYLQSSHLHSENVKIKIHKIIIFPVVLCGCGTSGRHGNFRNGSELVET
jgi:hypothetical protein